MSIAFLKQIFDRMFSYKINIYKKIIFILLLIVFVIATYFIVIKYQNYIHAQRTLQFVNTMYEIEHKDRNEKINILKKAYHNSKGNMKAFYGFKLIDIYLLDQNYNSSIVILKSIYNDYFVDNLIKEFTIYHYINILLYYEDDKSLYEARNILLKINKKSKNWEIFQEKLIIVEVLLKNYDFAKTLLHLLKNEKLVVLKEKDLEKLEYFINAR